MRREERRRRLREEPAWIHAGNAGGGGRVDAFPQRSGLDPSRRERGCPSNTEAREGLRDDGVSGAKAMPPSMQPPRGTSLRAKIRKKRGGPMATWHAAAHV